MFLSSIIFASVLFSTAVQAHFQLQYPIPRGPFVQDSEPTFCDGYTDAVNNRTVFPLSNGIINMNSEHPLWTAGVIISTDQNPNNFSDFNSSSGYQTVVPFFQQSGEGLYCFSIDLAAAATNVSGIKDGANVTIQVLFDGGDGTLYQCADLTLSASMTVPPSNASSGCTNVSSSTTTSTSSSAGKGVEVGSGLIAAGVLTMAMMLLSAV